MGGGSRQDWSGPCHAYSCHPRLGRALFFFESQLVTTDFVPSVLFQFFLLGWVPSSFPAGSYSWGMWLLGLEWLAPSPLTCWGPVVGQLIIKVG